MQQLKKEIDIVAASELNVLVGGETGTEGKSWSLNLSMKNPLRTNHPLIYLNCAALPEVWRKVNYSVM
ncbi:sigma 54-interacting transcriptional regulator [Providencia huaxiensis]|uniref:sigma 54-interacting transcriptional regulator n=1 Tax=Providencia huaxiensis TaxID=2027290 RepID=UPI003F81D244